MSSAQAEPLEPWMLHYYPFEGTRVFSEAAAAFVNRFFAPAAPLRPDGVLGVCGTCSVFDIVGHAVGDPGGECKTSFIISHHSLHPDVFLCPTPVYPGVKSDFFDRSLVDIHPVPLTSKVLWKSAYDPGSV